MPPLFPSFHPSKTFKDIFQQQDALYYAVFFDIAPQHLLAFEHGLITEAQAIEELEPKTARFHLWQSCMELSRWVVLEAFREAAGGPGMEKNQGYNLHGTGGGVEANMQWYHFDSPSISV